MIDDHEDALVAVKKMLELLGHEVMTAKNALTGFGLAREKVPEVILCDIGIPGGMSGYDFAAAIRADSAYQEHVPCCCFGLWPRGP